MKPCTNKPCSGCPMRRKSFPGWLGAATPENFIQTAHSDEEMPCHQTVDYERKDWRQTLHEATACAGVAVYFANIGKLSRDRSRRRLKADKVNVFSSPVEFVKHHCSLGIISGSDEDDET